MGQNMSTVNNTESNIKYDIDGLDMDNIDIVTDMRKCRDEMRELETKIKDFDLCLKESFEKIFSVAKERDEREREARKDRGDETSDSFYDYFPRNQSIEAYSSHAVFLAKKGLYLDSFVNFKSAIVRAEVAKYENYADKFVNDESFYVKKALAEAGFNLETYIDDKNPSIRAAVAKNGYELEELKDDPSWLVRREVAKQGHDPLFFVNDKNPYVREAAAKFEDCAKILFNDDDPVVRYEVASNGFCLKEFSETESGESFISRRILDKVAEHVGKKLKSFSKEEYKTPEYIRYSQMADNLIEKSNTIEDGEYIRINIVKGHYRPELFLNDPDPSVRATLAKEGFFSEIFKAEITKETNENFYLRSEMARAGFFPEIFIESEDPRIRAGVYSSGNYLDLAATDPDIFEDSLSEGFNPYEAITNKKTIAYAMAKQGVLLDKLFENRDKLSEDTKRIVIIEQGFGLKETALDTESELCFDAIDKIIETKKTLQIELNSLREEIHSLTNSLENYWPAKEADRDYGMRLYLEEKGIDVDNVDNIEETYYLVSGEVNDDEINDFEVNDEEFDDR